MTARMALCLDTHSSMIWLGITVAGNHCGSCNGAVVSADMDSFTNPCLSTLYYTFCESSLQLRS